MDFLTHLKTPLNNAQPGFPHVTIPTYVLNSIAAAQNNLTNMVKDLSAKKVVTEEEGEKNDNEDAPIIKRKLRCFLQNRSGVSDFISNVDSSADAKTMAEPYAPAYQPPHFLKKVWCY